MPWGGEGSSTEFSTIENLDGFPYLFSFFSSFFQKSKYNRLFFTAQNSIVGYMVL